MTTDEELTQILVLGTPEANKAINEIPSMQEFGRQLVACLITLGILSVFGTFINIKSGD
jgi:hypothetical protein